MTYIKLGFVNTAATNESPETQAAKLAEAGYKMQREGPDVEPFLPFLREGDIIAVSRIQRLAPNLTALRKVTDILNEAGVNLQVLDIDINTATLEGKRALDLILTYEKEVTQTQKTDPQSDRQNINPKADVIKPVQIEMFQNMPVSESPKPPVYRHQNKSLNWTNIGLMALSGLSTAQICRYTGYSYAACKSALRSMIKTGQIRDQGTPSTRLASAYLCKAGVPVSEVAKLLNLAEKTVKNYCGMVDFYPKFYKKRNFARKAA